MIKVFMLKVKQKNIRERKSVDLNARISREIQGIHVSHGTCTNNHLLISMYIQISIFSIT